MDYYILPQFEERTSYGVKRVDPYTKLFEDRIIFLGVQIDDASPTTSWRSCCAAVDGPRARHLRCTSTAPVARSRR
jgi:ATP-dependent protease ClpP protease subunit